MLLDAKERRTDDGEPVPGEIRRLVSRRTCLSVSHIPQYIIDRSVDDKSSQYEHTQAPRINKAHPVFLCGECESQ
jgi:hypothetical protein